MGQALFTAEKLANLVFLHRLLKDKSKLLLKKLYELTASEGSVLQLLDDPDFKDFSPHFSALRHSEPTKEDVFQAIDALSDERAKAVANKLNYILQKMHK